MIEWIVAYDDDGNEEVHGELVRCKDCRHWNPSSQDDGVYEDDGGYGVCDLDDWYSPERFYCADGERREVTR